MKLAKDVTPEDSLELTFQHEGEFVKDWCRVLEVSSTVFGHLTFRMISAGGIYVKQDFIHEDELTDLPAA